MEYMRAVYMDVDAVYITAIQITTNMIAFFYHQAPFAPVSCLSGKHRAEKAAANYQVIIFLQY